MPSHTGAKTIACTAFALAGFAANSLLTRAAVGPGAIDAVAFSGVRLLTGALALTAIALLARVPRLENERRAPWAPWTGAMALAGYAYAFGFAYTRIDAGVGALILFGAVQLTMTAWGLWRGERPRALEWAGLGAAVAGLVVLVRPGLAAPDPVGALLMAAAGASWGAYSLLGRATGSPLARTAANFVRASAIGVALLAVAWPLAATPAGLAYATASGALASGVGYTLWYMALPGLTRFRAAVVQLAVPAVTGLAAWPLLGEPLTGRLAGAAVLVLGGILVACLARPR